MIVIGGIGRAEGAVVGTLVVTYIDLLLHRHRREAHPARRDPDARSRCCSRAAARSGCSDQLREMRAKRRKAERVAARSTRHGEVLPEEAADIRDKSTIYQRRFDNAQREHLKLADHRRPDRGAPPQPDRAALGEPRARDAVLPQARPGRQVLRVRDRAVQDATGSWRCRACPACRPASSTTASTRRSTTRTTRCSCAASTTCAPPTDPERHPWRGSSSPATPTTSASPRATPSSSWSAPRARPR